MIERSEFQYQLVAEDYAAYASDNYSPARNRAKGAKTLRYVFPVVILVSQLAYAIARRRWTTLDTFWVVVAAAWFFFFPKWFARSMSSRLRDNAESESSKGSLGFRELILDESGVTERTEFGQVQRHWHGLERLSETPSHLFIYYGKHAAFIVPKSWLGESAGGLKDALERGMASVSANV
jgi:hypothetical protein